MNRKRKTLPPLTGTLALALIMALNVMTPLPAGASPDPYANETPEEREDRMAWFHEAKFGLFIHWGVYAVPAGIHEGKRSSGEWIMHSSKIPVERYKKYAAEFNPKHYDPDAWVRLAKEAGMKYIVITAKHHDGFALFDSKVSEWDVVDATPYGKDLIGPLAAACRKQGVKLGLYYSQAQDWVQGGAAEPSWDPKQKELTMDEYIDRIAVPQVKEILTQYGPIAILWWDTPAKMNRDRAGKLSALLELQPGIIQNDRLGGGYRGDTATPEGHIPATGIDGVWETCMVMNRTWGYKSWHHDWTPADQLLRNLIDIASKGGNYLLNVGPDAEGVIPAPSVERLKAIGQWMRANGESIYGTIASPTRRPKFGRITQKVIEGNATLYLHVFDWPEDGSIQVAVENDVYSVSLLADPGRALQVSKNEKGLTVHLTGEATDPVASVVVLKLKGEAQVSPLDDIRQHPDGSLVLPVDRADIHQRTGADVKVDGKNSSIGYWTDSRVAVEWTFMIDKPGTFAVTTETASVKESAFQVSLAEQSKEVPVASSGHYGTYQPLDVGPYALEKSGKYTIIFKPVGTSWNPVNLRAVTLTPVGERSELE